MSHKRELQNIAILHRYQYINANVCGSSQQSTGSRWQVCIWVVGAQVVCMRLAVLTTVELCMESLLNVAMTVPVNSPSQSVYLAASHAMVGNPSSGNVGQSELEGLKVLHTTWNIVRPRRKLPDTLTTSL